MNFIEKRRSAGHEDGKEIVYSEAYEALSDFEHKTRVLKNAQIRLDEAQKKVSDSFLLMKTSEGVFLDALWKHYEGDMPSAINSAFGTLLIDYPEDSAPSITVIESTSYADLYRIEEKAGKKVPA